MSFPTWFVFIFAINCWAIANGVIRSNRVADIMRKVDRGNFSADKTQSYNDNPSGIGHMQTISAPHMHAMCLELLEDHIKEGSHVLDVGSGSGYLVACFGLMVGKTGKVIGIERIKDLVDQSIVNMKKEHKDLLDSGVASIIHADGWEVLPENLKFDAIHVGAAADSVPKALVDQLKPGGRMLIPVGAEYEEQYLMQIDKDLHGKIHQQKACAVRYVPLVKGL